LSGELFPERLHALDQARVRTGIVTALNPGVFDPANQRTLGPKENAEERLVDKLEVRWRVETGGNRKEGILEVRFPHLFANPGFLVDRLEGVLAQELKTEKTWRWAEYPVDCLSVRVNGRVIPVGQGFRVPADLLCSTPSALETQREACALTAEEGERMQELLQKLNFYSTSEPVFSGSEIAGSASTPVCVQEWEKHPEVKDALRRFQAQSGVSHDGRFGRNTRAALRRRCEQLNIALEP